MHIRPPAFSSLTTTWSTTLWLISVLPTAKSTLWPFFWAFRHGVNAHYDISFPCIASFVVFLVFLAACCLLSDLFCVLTMGSFTTHACLALGFRPWHMHGVGFFFRSISAFTCYEMNCGRDERGVLLIRIPIYVVVCWSMFESKILYITLILLLLLLLLLLLFTAFSVVSLWWKFFVVLSPNPHFDVRDC